MRLTAHLLALTTSVLAAATATGTATGATGEPADHAQRADGVVTEAPPGSLSLGDVASPPEGAGLDRATLRAAAEGELRSVEATSRGRTRRSRPVVVSVAVSEATASPASCTVQALLHDRKSGVMIAVLSGRARVEGDSSPSQRAALARAALRNAVVQIPTALATR